MISSESDIFLISQSLFPHDLISHLSLVPLSNRKSSTVPDSVAMTMLARKRPSPVIQVTVKQTETDPGLIGVVSDNEKMNFCQCERAVSTYIMSSFYSRVSELSPMQDCSKSDEGVKTGEGDAYLFLA